MKKKLNKNVKELKNIIAYLCCKAVRGSQFYFVDLHEQNTLNFVTKFCNEY